MSVTGVCHICSSTAQHTCDSCGGAVCGEHYDATSGFCDECSGGRRY